MALGHTTFTAGFSPLVTSQATLQSSSSPVQNALPEDHLPRSQPAQTPCLLRQRSSLHVLPTHQQKMNMCQSRRVDAWRSRVVWLCDLDVGHCGHRPGLSPGGESIKTQCY